METNIDSTQASTGLRPTFLTVLCILTFLGSGWGIVSGLRDFATADSKAAMASETLSKAEDQVADAGSNFVTNMFSSISASMTAENIRKISIGGAIACLFTLIGAIMMWRLSKTGYYIYIAGVVISIIAPLVLLGVNIAGGIYALGPAIGGLLFIVLYGVNAKHLTK